MIKPADIVNQAKKYIGISESPPNSNNTIFGEWYGKNGVPWCSIFVYYVFHHAGFPLPELVHPKSSALVPHVKEYFEKQNCLINEPMIGALVFFDFSEQKRIAEHIGIVTGFNDNTVYTIEGKTSDNGGSVAERSRNLSVISGFAYPDYPKKMIIKI